MNEQEISFHFYRGPGFMMLGDSEFAKRYRKNRPDILWAKVKAELGIKISQNGENYQCKQKF